MVEILQGSQRKNLFSEREIFEESFPSAKSWQHIEAIINFPEGVSGLRILDVGGGGSDITAHLLEKGADAYACDPRYKSRSNVKGDTRRNLANLKAKRGDDQVWREYLRQQHQALEHFAASFKGNPDRYLPAFASKIPFPDNHFDLVFSVNCVCEYLDVDPKILSAAVAECVRITKPGGVIQFFPFEDAFLPQEQRNDSDENYRIKYYLRRRNQNSLLDLLKASTNLDFFVPPIPQSNHKKLVIFKK